MNLKRRLKYYFIGILMGGIISFLIFGDRGWDWLPGNRVIKSIKNSKIIISENEKCLLDCNNITSKQIYNLINNGSVNFRKSDTKNKNYLLYNDSLSIYFKIIKKHSTNTVAVNNVPNSNNCNCKNHNRNKYTVLYKPNEMVLEKLKSLKLSIKKEVECELECFNLKKEDVEKSLKEGEILFKQSYPNRYPNPIYYIKHKKNTKYYLYWFEQGATKTRLLHVVNYNKNNIKKGEPLSNIFKKSIQIKDCGCYN